MGAVLKHDFQQIAGGLGAVDRFVKAVPDQQGQQARVVDVGMGNQDEVNIAGLIGFDVAVALLNGLVALVHAAVHAEALAAGLDHVAGTGDCLGRAQKLYFHMHSEWVVDGQRPQRAPARHCGNASHSRKPVAVSNGRRFAACLRALAAALRLTYSETGFARVRGLRRLRRRHVDSSRKERLCLNYDRT